MKKAYINPEIIIVEMETQKMLAASDPALGGQYGGSDPILAPELDFDPVDIDNLLK